MTYALYVYFGGTLSEAMYYWQQYLNAKTTATLSEGE